MLSPDLEEEELKSIYASFRNRHEMACHYFVEQAEMLASGILGSGEITEVSTSDPVELITFSALLGGFSRLMAEKLIQLEGVRLGDLDPEETQVPQD